MKTVCPSCAAENGLLRLLLRPSGVHIRCRACGTVYRLVQTVGGLFTVMLAFGAAYVAAFYGMTFVRAPARWDFPWDALWLAAPPAVPAVVVAIVTIQALWRVGPPTDAEVRPLTPVAYAVGYLLATAATTAVVVVVVFGILMARFGEPLPRLAIERWEPVVIEEPVLRGWEFVDLEGQSRTIAGLRGSVVFVHVFVPGDRPTAAGLETIRELRKTAVDDGVVFALIAETDLAGLREFAAIAPKLPYTYAPAAMPDVLEQIVASAGGGRPATFVLDKAGRIAFAHVGPVNWATAEVRGFLTRLARDG